MSLRMKCLAEFREPPEDGVADVQGRIVSGNLTIKAEGEEAAVPLEGMVVNYRLARSGEIKAREVVSGDPAILPEVFLIFGPDDSFLIGGLARLPSDPVRVGDTWKATVQKTNWATGEAAPMYLESRLLGAESYGGRPCVRIRTTAKVGYSQALLDPEIGGTASVKATNSAVATWRFDYQRGLAMWAEVSSRTSETASFTDGAGASFTDTISAVAAARIAMTEFRPRQQAGEAAPGRVQARPPT